jgi:hypothetical protein
VLLDHAPAVAGRDQGVPVQGYVIAYSHDGNGSIKAPWRDTKMGRQVRLPHGTWVYCRASCSETLRVETIDLGQRQQRFADRRRHHPERVRNCGLPPLVVELLRSPASLTKSGVVALLGNVRI